MLLSLFGYSGFFLPVCTVLARVFTCFHDVLVGVWIVAYAIVVVWGAPFGSCTDHACHIVLASIFRSSKKFRHLVWPVLRLVRRVR